MTMLTVQDLVANPTLRTRVLAGSGGIERELTWAHSIELPEPWAWMGNGELLMTTGQNFPATINYAPMGKILQQRSLGQVAKITLGGKPLIKLPAAT